MSSSTRRPLLCTMDDMMSPTTARLLADMNNLSRAAAGGAASANSSNGNNGDGVKKRRPLGAIGTNIDNAATFTDAAIGESLAIATTSIKRNNIRRTIGPHERNYIRNYDAYVTRKIQHFATKLMSSSSNNIGKYNNSDNSLPSYNLMSEGQRDRAFNNVNRLLERLTLEMKNKKNGGEAVASTSSMDTSSGSIARDEATFLDTQLSNSHHNNSNEDCNSNNDLNDESFGSATTMGGYDDYDNNKINTSTGSETTVMQQSMSLLGSSSTSTTNDTTIATQKSTSLFAREQVNRSTINSSKRNSVDSDATTAFEQSMSLLGDDDDDVDGRCHHFFIEDTTDGVCDVHVDHATRVAAVAATTTTVVAAAPPPIEKVRRYHQSNDDDKNRMTMMASPTQHPSSSSSYYNDNHKRYASNSGKRGLKSRMRYQEYDYDDNHGAGGGGGDCCLGDARMEDNDFDHIAKYENGCGGSVMFPSQEDEFISPIQHRFSHDGLESDFDGIHSNNYENHDDVELRNGRFDRNDNLLFTQQEEKGDALIINGNNDGDYDFDVVDDDDKIVGGGNNNNWKSSNNGRPVIQSQWSTFKTVDPTATQINNEEDSPFKRRAIRFESTLKGYYSRQQQMKQREQEDDNDKIQSMRDDLANMAVKDLVSSGQDDDPIQTIGNLCRRARTCEEGGMDAYLLDEVAPIDVRLRDGHLFHKDPLECRQVQKKKKKASSQVKLRGTKTVRKARSNCSNNHEASDLEESLSDPDTSFNDPTSLFPSRVADRLNAAFDFMVKNDSRHATNAANIIINADHDRGVDRNAGVILSLDLKQIMAVTSKLLLRTKTSARSYRNSKNRKMSFTPSTTATVKDSDYLAGATLIILREKEDLPKWEAALREHTSLSVFNHLSLQANQRKNANAAAKCAVYDVVLTTYDLLKCKEATIPVDSLGKAILECDRKSNADDGGWLTKRGSGTESDEAQKCHQLSILHRMSWYRVIMMDALGRKGYMTKLNSARSIAATAVNSLSRFLFFVKEEEDNKLENKFKNDKKQIKSVMVALHLPAGTRSIDFFQHWAHDVKSNIKDGSNLDSSSCDDDKSLYDDGINC